jgi:hypothetical protein
MTTALETAVHAEPLSEEAERMLQTYTLDQARYVLPLSDPLIIFSNIRHMAKFVDSFKVDEFEDDDREDIAIIKSMWAENCEEITPLIVQSLAEQTASPVAETPNTVQLIDLYGQQLDLVEQLVEFSEAY